MLIWWNHLPPSNDRPWADDVARVMTGTVDGDRVVLHNVRNFDWRSDSDYTQRWEIRSYDLSRVRSVDMIMSYWSWRAIAHMMISFGFEGGDHLVFSVEIRPSRDQSYSEIGGFFKAVSYTHLDVYKRQARRCSRRRSPFCSSGGITCRRRMIAPGRTTWRA